MKKPVPGKYGNMQRYERRSLPISKLIPNMVTLMTLCFGLSSVRYALLSKWEMAVSFILIAAFLDGIDGRLARLLNASSNFGAHLDSLADFVNFGVAPGFVLYLWTIEQMPVKGLGWAFVLFYSICCAIRLARFNTNLEDEEVPEWMDKFFIGIPSPVGAALAIAPMTLAFQFGDGLFRSPEGVGLYMSLIALLMASRIPTVSIKKMVVGREYVSLTLVLAGLLIAALIIEPWLTLPVIGLIYVLSIPFSCISYYRLKRAR
jgi:CDP-diacylglycerol--serine O-phosphatidyltransferase